MELARHVQSNGSEIRLLCHLPFVRVGFKVRVHGPEFEILRTMFKMIESLWVPYPFVSDYEYPFGSFSPVLAKNFMVYEDRVPTPDFGKSRGFGGLDWLEPNLKVLTLYFCYSAVHEDGLEIGQLKFPI